MARKKRKPEGDVKMDMTPMIDVTFLIIIFFLCLEFKTLEGKLSANLPKDVGVNTSKAPPMEKLDIRIVCPKGGWGKKKLTNTVYANNQRRFELLGHKVYWYIGPKKITTIPGLEKELRKQAKKKIKDPKTQKMKTKAITIKAGPGVTYGDVTAVVDIALDAKFQEITFGGGEGTRAQQQAKRAKRK
jgi:biopolymer transport protein ExbD